MEKLIDMLEENDDVQNPDLLSLKIYGKQDYWWILCKINNIQDVWNDIKPGDIIIVPDISDIEDFYTRIKKKKKSKVEIISLNRKLIEILLKMEQI